MSFSSCGRAAGVGLAWVLLTLSAPAATQPVIIDHTCTHLQTIPASAIAQAKTALRIAYGHTSHGSQLIDGMSGLVPFMNRFANDAYADNLFTFNSDGSGGALQLVDFYGGFGGSSANDLGAPNRTAWADATRTYLNSHPQINVIIWSWCGEVDGTQAEIQQYLTLMSGLEQDFPSVKFVYMTGHLNGTGASGNVNVRNNQIRDYCRANNKILYDFADIESYDPDGAVNYMALYADDGCNYDSDANGSLDKNWALAWQQSHIENVDWYNCSAAHSQALNANRKAYAAWWLWARLAGWPGSSTTDTEAPTAPTNLAITSVGATSVGLSWTASTDNVGVVGYAVYRGTTLAGTTAFTAYTDGGRSPSTAYAYSVEAYDAASNFSTRSSTLNVTTTSTSGSSSGSSSSSSSGSSSSSSSSSSSGGSQVQGTSSSGGGGGAPSVHLFAALVLLGLRRLYSKHR